VSLIIILVLNDDVLTVTGRRRSPVLWAV